MSISVAQCRAARGLVGWSQADLAAESRVSASAIANFENERTVPVANNIDAIVRAFQRAGVQFIAENGGGPGVRLAKPKNEASLESQIDTLHAEADALDTSGPASPRKALNTMKQAIARNDARKLTARGKKKP